MSGSESPALSFGGVFAHLGPRAVLKDVSFEVRPGEFVALAGPNGAGKTTLLRAALGLLAPSAGRVRLFDTPVGELGIRERARRVAWVPQEESLRDDVPIGTYVLYGRFAHLGPFDAESPEDLRKAREALHAVGLLDRAEDGILNVSGGERQRLVLARALAQDAPLLLLDEPTAHLDIGHQLDLLDRVRAQVRSRRLAVVAAIHDLNLAARFADRILVLSHGRIVAEGPPARVLSGALLRTVWGVAADLRTDGRSGVPYLVPRLPAESGPVPAMAGGWGPVHVVGGGGAATPWLHALVEGGYRVTAGALHLLDSDAETAESLGVPTVLEVPFAPLGTEARTQNRRRIAEARAIVVAPFATGPSNLGNLQDLTAASPGTPILLVGHVPMEALDFAGGAATVLRQELIARGAETLPDDAALMQRLRAIRAEAGEPATPPGAPPAASP
ncbi:MAG TPA: ABC transporter ATP-binding protein [Thermoplasmata archaeon]|nr:ABC transporter ATP-binding protein [Thermoplasmata archaeon]